MDIAPELVPEAQKIRKRAPIPKALQLKVFQRDQWLCFWCLRPVIFSPAFKLIDRELKGAGFAQLAYYHPHGTRRDAPLLDELGAAVDHVEAFSTGGQCNLNNFRTACWKCNTRKGNNAVKRWEQRKRRAAIKGKYGEPTNWDGLTSLFMFLAERNPRHLESSEKAWLKALRSQC